MKKLFNRGMSLTLIVCLTFVICLCGCNNTDVTSSDTVTSSDVSSNTAISSSTSSTTSKTVSKADKTASKISQTSKTSSESQTSSEAELIIPEIIIPEKRKSIFQDFHKDSEWYKSMDVAPFLLEEGIEVEGEIMVDYCVIFEWPDYYSNYDPTIKLVIDKQSLTNAIVKIYTDMINDYLTENNFTREDLLEMLGATLDSYIEYFIQEEAKAAVEKMNLTIKSAGYSFVAGVLYIKNYGDEYYRVVEHFYDEEKDQLTLTDGGATIVLNRKIK